MNKKILLLLLLFYMPMSHAVAVQGRWVNPITDICWKCLFPLTIGNIPVTGTTGQTDMPSGAFNPDTPNPSSPLQLCPMGVFYRLGIAIGYWEPFAMTDVTPTPGLMVNLGGVKINMGMVQTGVSTQSTNSKDQSFYHVHWYKYPLISWLNVISSVACMQTGDMDIGYMSELDPTWDDSSTAAILNPEAILYANPIAQAACAADSLSALVSSPIDSLYWCAGSQGSMYPFTGFTSNSFSPLQVSLLLTERMDYKLHREGLVQDSIGVNTAVCSTYPSAIIPKSRYRYQLVNIIPDMLSCHPFGRTTLSWEMGHNTPIGQRNFGYVVWRKRNCVVL